MERRSMYVDALRIAFEMPDQKKSLNNLVVKLTEKGYKIEPQHKNTPFTYWYFTNFYSNDGAPLLKSDAISVLSTEFSRYYGPDTECPMTSDAIDTLLEYESLAQAREDAKIAKNQARIAIWITCIIGVIQILLAISVAGA
jgi:hypothetical protein